MTLTPNLRGALWMLASALGFTAMTTLIKYLGPGYPAALQTFYRQLAGVVVLLPLIARDWRAAFRTTRPGILIFRSSAGVLALIMGFYAYQKLPLADANALSFTRTLWLVPLAGLVLREPIGPLRIGAAVVGFVGVLIMLRPGAGGASHWLGWPQACALASAFLFALTITGMKVMTRDHSPFVLLVYAAVLGVVFAIPPALFVWKWPSLRDLALLSAMGVIGTFTQGAYIKGMEAGEAAVMAPIDYTRLVFAVAAGLLLFHEVPRAAVIVGAAIVIASTLFISWREHQLARRAAIAPQPA
ncbi:DMT family transporter [Caulobacter sp. SSI4214]|uniref:DMT family transporter n=1 Tax=Caulobacter sp. SSI4214 TaxID=2575739 RepID=UPI00143BE2FE|nr:DMT family transporter [Caulobacter sp. SSI4214]